MRVAVYREAHRGSEPGDFAWTHEGELLTLGMPCGDSLEAREACGCGRAFAGLDSKAGCTTAVVEERDDGEALAALRGSSFYAGWAADDPECGEEIEAAFRALCELLPAAGRVVRVRNGPERFEVYERRPRRLAQGSRR